VSTLARRTAAMIARQATPAGQVGRVVTVGAGTATVAVAGQHVAGVRVAAGLTLAAGDVVVLLATAGQLTALARLPATVAGVEDEVVDVAPLEETEVELWPNGQWRWGSTAAPGPMGASLRQGRFYSQATILGAPGMRTPVALVRFPPLGAQLPSGATITQVRLIVSRRFLLQDAQGNLLTSQELAATSPVLHGHGYATFPAAGAGPAPAFATGFGPWRPGPIVHGETAAFILPAAWVTALLAGTLTGLGTWSTSTSDYAWFLGEGNATLRVYYTPPPLP
jgi:hypothetical protein